MLHYDTSLHQMRLNIMSSTTTETEDDQFRMRFNSKQFQAYKDKVKELTGRSHTDFTRELLIAFTEGRVTITPSPTQKNFLKDVYNVD